MGDKEEEMHRGGVRGEGSEQHSDSIMKHADVTDGVLQGFSTSCNMSSQEMHKSTVAAFDVDNSVLKLITNNTESGIRPHSGAPIIGMNQILSSDWLCS